MADEQVEHLAEYSSDEEEAENLEVTEKQESDINKDTYSTLNSSGFKEFLLKAALLRAIVDCGFEHPSDVQNQCIPAAITGTDILCQAKSGMGKTAVFVISILQQLEEKPEGVKCLVLCHARELAYQICHEFERFIKYMPNIKCSVFYGGIPYRTHAKLLKEDPPNIVIGTPGRILALVDQRDLNLNECKYFVLDECDTMLESLDMRKDVQKIFRATPHTKQVMMFSATLSEDVKPVCKKFMHNPREIYVNAGEKLTLHGLKQYYLELEESSKTRKLVDLLDALEFNQAVVFVSSIKRAKELNKILVECNFPSISIHGGRAISQEERIQRYKKFKEFRARIVVCTNLLGRGIDIERVNVVINYDMPKDADTYLHRVGRAGRFGTKGLAISFISSPADGLVLNEVQNVFVVDIPELPDEIDASSYMQS